jgi:cytochrome c peroxidase
MRWLEDAKSVVMVPTSLWIAGIIGCGPMPAEPCDALGCDEDFVAEVLARFGTLPEGPPPDPTNAYADDPAAARLGHHLFFDPRYSRDGSISCATCHVPDARYQDDRNPTSAGLDDRFTGRRAPSVYNAAYGAMLEDVEPTVWQFWDGRADSTWSQALGPPEDPVEMGGTRSRVALLLHDVYRDDYESIFGPMPDLREAGGAPIIDPGAMPGTGAWAEMSVAEQDAINRIYANFGKALAAYQRRIVSRDSRFDRFYEDLLRDGRSDALSQSELEGLALFMGEAGCASCHAGPNFSDWSFRNIGVPQEGEHVPAWDFGRQVAIAVVVEDVFNCAGPYSDHPEKGACAVHDLEPHVSDLGAFKTPTLRHVEEAGPYMHTGGFESLEAVIDHYDRGGRAEPDPADEDRPRAVLPQYVGEIDRDVMPLNLDDHQKAALIAFLKTLTGAPIDPALGEAPELRE